MKHSHTVVITGAGRGIGLELTRQALSRGDTVWTIVRNPDKSEGLKALGGDFKDRLHVIKGDVNSDKDIESFVGQISKVNKSVDMLINNAGVYLDGDSDFESLELDKVVENFKTNTVAPMRVSRALLGQLKKSSKPVIVNITSLMGSMEDNSSGGSYAYRISKAALNMFTKNIAIDQKDITTISIHPGWVQTDMGGTHAPTTPAESASGILKVAEGVTAKDSGRFFDFEGDSIAW